MRRPGAAAPLGAVLVLAFAVAGFAVVAPLVFQNALRASRAVRVALAMLLVAPLGLVLRSGYASWNGSTRGCAVGEGHERLRVVRTILAIMDECS